VIALMDSNVKDPINLGHDQAHTLTEIAQKIIELTNSQAKIAYQENFAYINKPAIPDITKAKTELGWMPLISLEDGLKQTIDYLRSQSRLYQPFFSDDDKKDD